MRRARTSTKQRVQALALSMAALLGLGYGLGRVAAPAVPTVEGTTLALGAR